LVKPGLAGFPTLLLHTGDRTGLLARGLTPLANLEAALTRLTQH
jgi:protein-disulfide isomerase-like protein with CxxC motif